MGRLVDARHAYTRFFDLPDVAACLTGGGPKNDFETETFSMQSLTGTVSHPLTGATSVIEAGNGRGVPRCCWSLSAQAGGGSTCYALAPVAFAQNSRGELRLEGGLGQRFGALSTGGGKPGQDVPMIASVALRGRPQGIRAELGGNIAYAICASTGGGEQPHVLFPSLESHCNASRCLKPVGAEPAEHCGACAG